MCSVIAPLLLDLTLVLYRSYREVYVTHQSLTVRPQRRPSVKTLLPHVRALESLHTSHPVIPYVLVKLMCIHVCVSGSVDLVVIVGSRDPRDDDPRFTNTRVF